MRCDADPAGSGGDVDAGGVQAGERLLDGVRAVGLEEDEGRALAPGDRAEQRPVRGQAVDQLVDQHLVVPFDLVEAVVEQQPDGAVPGGNVDRLAVQKTS